MTGAATTTIDWDDQPSADRYDLARGLASQLGPGSTGSCLVEDLVASTHDDADGPPSGDAFFYIVRGEDSAGCGGPGSSGQGTDGSPRQPSGCAP